VVVGTLVSDTKDEFSDPKCLKEGVGDEDETGSASDSFHTVADPSEASHQIAASPYHTPCAGQVPYHIDLSNPLAQAQAPTHASVPVTAGLPRPTGAPVVHQPPTPRAAQTSRPSTGRGAFAAMSNWVARFIGGHVADFVAVRVFAYKTGTRAISA